MTKLFPFGILIFILLSCQTTAPSRTDEDRANDLKKFSGPVSLLDGTYIVNRIGCDNAFDAVDREVCNRSVFEIRNGVGKGVEYNPMANTVKLNRRWTSVRFSDVVEGRFNVVSAMEKDENFFNLTPNGPKFTRSTSSVGGKVQLDWFGNQLEFISWKEEDGKNVRLAKVFSGGLTAWDQTNRKRDAESAARQKRKSETENQIKTGLAVLAGVAGTSGQTSQGQSSSGQSASTNVTAANGNADDSKDVTPATRKDLGKFFVSQRKVEICVWDYQCEDGDRVSVEITSTGTGFNANQVRTAKPYSNIKLTNKPFCFNTTVSDGGIGVRLRALNGTGFEGQCNHANANTGAMSVSGGGGRDTWRISGGSGTTAKIEYRP